MTKTDFTDTDATVAMMFQEYLDEATRTACNGKLSEIKIQPEAEFNAEIGSLAKKRGPMASFMVATLTLHRAADVLLTRGLANKDQTLPSRRDVHDKCRMHYLRMISIFTNKKLRTTPISLASTSKEAADYAEEAPSETDILDKKDWYVVHGEPIVTVFVHTMIKYMNDQMTA